jgi:hypothetical protein
MQRQTVLGALFIVIGIAVVGAAIVPAFAHPPQPLSLWILLAGLGVLVFGAWLIPSSGAGQTFNQIVVSLGNTSLPFVGGKPGGQRAGDPPANPPAPTEKA